MSSDELKRKKKEILEGYKFYIPTRKFGMNMFINTKFRKEHKTVFCIDSYLPSRLFLSKLRKVYSEDLENYTPSQIIRDGAFLKLGTPVDFLPKSVLMVREKIQLNKRIFSVDFYIEDDTHNPIPSNCLGVIGAEFFTKHNAIIDYESKRIWIDK